MTKKIREKKQRKSFFDQERKKKAIYITSFARVSVQMVAFLQGDRKFPISALTQSTADCCVYCELALSDASRRFKGR